MTIDSFVFNNHFSDSQAFNDYSSSVLKLKLMDVLGDTERDDLKKDIVDWELAKTRTSPADHKMKMGADTNLYLQATASGQKRAFSLLDEEVSIAQSQGRKVDELRSVIEDARRLTEMPEDFEQHRKYYHNKFLWALTSTQG